MARKTNYETGFLYKVRIELNIATLIEKLANKPTKNYLAKNVVECNLNLPGYQFIIEYPFSFPEHEHIILLSVSKKYKNHFYKIIYLNHEIWTVR